MARWACVLVLAAVCEPALAALRVSDGVVRYDVASRSWRAVLTDSAAPASGVAAPVADVDTVSLPMGWDAVMPLACAHADCTRQLAFDTGYMPCASIGAAVNSSRQFWQHARPGCTACASRRTDWIHVRPPLSLYVSADGARLRPYLRSGVLTVRVVWVRALEAPSTTCLVRSADISLTLPEYVPALASVVVENACAALGMTAPVEALLVALHTSGVLTCVWQCHPALVRVPWNAAPAAAGGASALACEAFPAEFTSVFVVAHLAVPNWWKASELGQEILDDVDAVGAGLARVLAPALAGAAVACAVRDSVYDFLSLQGNVEHHVAAAAQPGFEYEQIANTESVLAELASEPRGAALRLECRVTTSDVRKEPAELVARLRPSFRVAMAALVARQPAARLLHFDVAHVVRFSEAGTAAMQLADPVRAETIAQYRNGMAFVETLCVLVALALMAGRTAAAWQQ